MAGDKEKKEQSSSDRSSNKVEDLQHKISDKDAQTVKGGRAAEILKKK